METPPNDHLSRTWNTQLDAIPLRQPLKLRVIQSAAGFTLKNFEFNLIGDGNTIEKAMDMLVEKLVLDYYEFGLNPGSQSEEDLIFGLRLRKFFTRHQDDETQRVRRLLTFHEGRGSF